MEHLRADRRRASRAAPGGRKAASGAARQAWRIGSRRGPPSSLRENLDGSVRLAELARECDLSMSHFTRSPKASSASPLASVADQSGGSNAPRTCWRARTCRWPRSRATPGSVTSRLSRERSIASSGRRRVNGVASTERGRSGSAVESAVGHADNPLTRCPRIRHLTISTYVHIISPWVAHFEQGEAPQRRPSRRPPARVRRVERAGHRSRRRRAARLVHEPLRFEGSIRARDPRAVPRHDERRGRRDAAERRAASAPPAAGLDRQPARLSPARTICAAAASTAIS